MSRPSRDPTRTPSPRARACSAGLQPGIRPLWGAVSTPPTLVAVTRAVGLKLTVEAA